MMPTTFFRLQEPRLCVALATTATGFPVVLGLSATFALTPVNCKTNPRPQGSAHQETIYIFGSPIIAIHSLGNR